MEQGKLNKIQSAYLNAKIIRQNGDEDVKVNPFYITIHDNNRVREFKDLSMCLASNPEYVLGLTTIFSSGNRGYQRLNILPQIFGVINQESVILPEIELNNWTLSDIEFFSIEPTIINKAKFTLNTDYTQEYVIDYRDKPSHFRSFQTLWNLVVEIDNNCQTTEDVKDCYVNFIMELTGS